MHAEGTDLVYSCSRVSGVLMRAFGVMGVGVSVC